MKEMKLRAISRYKLWCLGVAGLTTAVLMGCSAEVKTSGTLPDGITATQVGDNGLPTPIPAPEETVVPTTCMTLAKKYMMNTDVIEIKQSGCKSLRWTWAGTYFNPNETHEEFYFDGKENLSTKAATWEGYRTSRWLDDTRFESTLRIMKNGVETKWYELFYLSKKPCNLYNPDGRFYLVRESKKVGSSGAMACDFWSPVGE